MDVKTNLSQGIACARSGKREEARAILLKVVEDDPKNLSAWLWLSDLVDDPQDRIIALENALIINPQQTQVRGRLEQIRAEVADREKPEVNSAVEPSGMTGSQLQTDWYQGRAQTPVGIADQFMLDLLNQKQATGNAGANPPDSRTSAPSAYPVITGEEVETPEPKSPQFQQSAPGVDPALARLGEFSPRLSDELKEKSAKRVEASLSQAREAFQAGKRQEGIDLLHQVVWNETENEEGWLLLSQTSFEMEEKVEALTKVVRINPQNLEARKQLDQWAPLLKSPIDLGRWYQTQGDLERALQAFMRASMEAHSVTAKTEADRSVIEVKKRIKEPQVKVISPTWTIFRLSVGPVLLYILLVFVQGGLNVLTLDPVLVLGLLFVIPGSIFLSISTTRPTHPAWIPLFRAMGEKHDGLVHFLVGAVSVFLLALPYSVLILNAVARLELLRLSNP